MPADAWLLLVLSVGLGLGLEIVYIRARWADRSPGGRYGRPRETGPTGEDRAGGEEPHPPERHPSGDEDRP